MRCADTRNREACRTMSLSGALDVLLNAAMIASESYFAT
jgi:hypothetical protein